MEERATERHVGRSTPGGLLRHSPEAPRRPCAPTIDRSAPTPVAPALAEHLTSPAKAPPAEDAGSR
jgi:hypothetical protein